MNLDILTTIKRTTNIFKTDILVISKKKKKAVVYFKKKKKSIPHENIIKELGKDIC